MPTSTIVSLFIVLALTACSAPGRDASGTGGAAGGGAGGGCPIGSHPSPDGGCSSTLTIAASPVAIAPPRDHHTTLVVEPAGQPYLYVFGGGRDDNTVIHDDIQRARIESDGSLGSFEIVGALPEGRLGHSTVLLGDRIVVAGGLTGEGDSRYLLSSTIVATLGPDGTLGAWEPGPPLPMPVMHHSCEAYGRRMLCIGGRIHGNYTGAMAVEATLGDDGVLGEYVPVTPLPHSIGFHQSFVHRDALYLAGGLHRDAPAADFDLLVETYRAPILAEGGIGAWERLGDLPFALQIGAAQPFGDRVYFVGGAAGYDTGWASVLTASFEPGGGLVDARVSPAALTSVRMHLHQAPVHGRWLYAVGGRDRSGASLGTVDLGTFE